MGKSITKRGVLKVQAELAAQSRNHRLGPWTNFNNKKASAVCEVCGKGAYVDAHPAANGIDVFGEAVALNCVRRIKISYDTVTPESAEIGDFAVCGWENEEGEIVKPDDSDIEEIGELAAVVACAIRVIGNVVEASDYPHCHPGHTWYTEIDGVQDCEVGSEKRLSYHLVNFSKEEELAIYAELMGR